MSSGPSPIILALTLFTLAVCALGLWQGGRSERLGAVIILANQALTFVMTYAFSERASVGALVQLALDGLTAAALLLVVLRYGKPWLGVAMLLYAAQFALHSFYLVTERPNDTLHAVANNAIFVGVNLSLAAGTAMAMLNRRKVAKRPWHGAR